MYVPQCGGSMEGNVKLNIGLEELLKRLGDICESVRGEMNTENTRKKLINKLTAEFNKYECSDIETLGLVWNPRMEATSDKSTLKVQYFNVPNAITWLKPKTKEDIKKRM